MSDSTTTGPVDPLEQQIRQVRRRRNLLELQRALYLLIATVSGSAAVLVMLALGASARLFSVVAWSVGVAVLVTAAMLVLEARRRWLAAARAPAWIDARAGLRGRLTTLVETRSRAVRPADAFFLPLLTEENMHRLDGWRAARMVPRRVPRGALASALATTGLLLLALSLAPGLRPQAPEIIYSDRPVEGLEASDEGDGLPDRIVVAPRPPSRAKQNARTAGTETDGEADEQSALARLGSALQDRIRRELWGDAWERMREAMARADDASRGDTGPGELDESDDGAPGDDWAALPPEQLALRTRPRGVEGAGWIRIGERGGQRCRRDTRRHGERGERRDGRRRACGRRRQRHRSQPFRSAERAPQWRGGDVRAGSRRPGAHAARRSAPCQRRGTSRRARQATRARTEPARARSRQQDGRAARVRDDRPRGLRPPRGGRRSGRGPAVTLAQATVAADAIRDFQETFAAVRAEIAKVVIGHEQVIETILSAFFAGGHVLIEGVPGTGKTLIVRSLAEALNLSFNRIQFTVDLMPADITGTRVINEGADGRREFLFVPGPVFAHILLADEINRATPKTQSALLEAMAEQQVTVAGTSYPLVSPFFVLATLNPIEMEGTYQLPEAQLDRFLFKVLLEYPSQLELERIVGTTTRAELPVISPVLARESAAARVEDLKRLVRQVLVAPHIERYVAGLVRLTIPAAQGKHPEGDGDGAATVMRYVTYGASPRGGQALVLGAKVLALLDGRGHVTFEDVDRVALAALRHRLVMNFAAEAAGVDAGYVVERVLAAAHQLRA